MPQNSAFKATNRFVLPLSTILCLTSIILVVLNIIGIISIPWWVALAPAALWVVLMVAMSMLFVSLVGLIALIKATKE